MTARNALFVLILAAALAHRAAAQEAKPSCVTHCHGAEAKAFTECVHEGRLACTDCHGGNPEAQRDQALSHDPAKGFVGKIAREKIPALCAACHSDPLKMHAFGLPTDQLAQYENSPHGKALAKGDQAVAVCTDCHGTHRILSARDPRSPTARVNQPATCGKCHSDEALMSARGLPFDNAERFSNSVHGVALLTDGARGAPSCADCHGAHGATPPGVGEVEQICGHCHANTAEHFRKGPHANGPAMHCRSCHEDKNGYEYNRSGCASCHGNHDIGTPGARMYSGTEVGHCGHCHRNDPAADSVIGVIVGGTKQLRDAMSATRDELKRAKKRGLFLEHEEVYLRESERALVSLRPLSHSMDADAIDKHLADGLRRQERTHESIGKKVVVLRDRRLLLSGLALILLLLAGLLAAKLAAVRRLS